MAWSVPGPWLPPRKPTCLPSASMRVASASSLVATIPSPLWMPPARSFGPPTMTFRPPPFVVWPVVAATMMACPTVSACPSSPVTLDRVSCIPKCSSTIAMVASLQSAVMVSSSSTPPRPSVTRPSDRPWTSFGLDRERATMPSGNPPRVSRYSRTSRSRKLSSRRHRLRRACSVDRWSESRVATRLSCFMIGNLVNSSVRLMSAPRRFTGRTLVTWFSWRVRTPPMC
mmetsp:Transcript_28409/g.57740  ORF Transcript_28409/g.57740 Transcript_28409/m.57740 type:complete len:228 (+) Transcript_28409:818-1501(+)